MSNIIEINAKTLKEWMENREAILIDVREIAEYNEAHIPDSILIPVNDCTPAIVPHNPNKKIVFHCKAGLRGGKACTTCAIAMPEKTVYNLIGGIDSWIEEGYDIERVEV